MKNIRNLLSVCLLVLIAVGLGSCDKDKGNYKYEDPDKMMAITISGIDPIIYTKMHLELTPTIDGMANEGDYEFTWRCVTKDNTGNKNVIIGQEKNLDCYLNTPEWGIDPGTYQLVLDVRDKKLDLMKRHTSIIVVSATDILDGWYVLKTLDGKTDFDYVTFDGNVYGNVLRDLALPGQSQLEGEAIKMAIHPFYAHQITNSEGKEEIITMQTALHIISDTDMKTVNIKTLEIFKTFDQEFFSIPANRKLQDISVAHNNAYLMNDGKVHTINGFSMNAGKFGAPKIGGDYFVGGMITTMMGAMGFDRNTHSFRSFSAMDSETGAFASTPDVSDPKTHEKPQNMQSTVLEFLPRPMANNGMNLGGDEMGYTILKSNTSNDYYIAEMRLMGNSYPFMTYNKVPASSKMPLSKARTTPVMGKFIYFGDGNKLMAYFDIPGISNQEVLVHQYPAGEEITSIQNQSMYWNEEMSPRNNVVVTTSTATGWNLYIHDLRNAGNPEINSTPVMTSSGKGKAKFVLYRGFNDL